MKMRANVFQPIPFEMARIRSPASDRRSLPKGVTKVRRVLFEPVNHEETQIFLEKQLSLQKIKDTQKWEFNFEKGMPISPSGKSGRLIWSAVTKATSVPFIPILKPPMDVEDNSDCYANPPPLNNITHIIPEARINDENKKQRLITDFLTQRKRTTDSSFVKETAPPRKIARLSFSNIPS